jgi:hypothetical protein
MFLTLLVTFSCKNKNSFYTYSADGDLYRMPLIEPYELIINKAGDNERYNSMFEYWNFKLIHGHYPFSSGGAKEVNVTNGIIYGFTPKSMDEPDIRFVLIPKKKEEKIFKNQENEWLDFLKSIGIDTIKLYDSWTIFDEFRKSKTLPWYDPKKGILPYSEK